MIDENFIMLIVWLSLFVIFLIIELSTEALVSIWFALGTLVALAVTYIPGMPWWGELLVFLGVSLIAFLALRPMIRKSGLKNSQSKTNIDTIIGKKGKVIKAITLLEPGEVKINGVIWTALRRESDADIPVDSIVSVISVTGNRLLVEKVEEKK